MQPKTTSQRGYGSEHRAERERWRPLVKAGEAQCAAIACLKPNRHIAPGDAWDLDHNDDRTGYRGPAHAGCNRSAGGVTAAIRHNPNRDLIVRTWGDPP